MRAVAAALAAVVLAAGCSAADRDAAPPAKRAQAKARKKPPAPKTPAQVALGLPRVRRGPLPGYLMIADRDNNRVLIVSPAKRIVWQTTNLRGPDDAFFTPGYRSIITNEEFHETVVELSLRTKRRIWTYGHSDVAGSSPGYLDTPDDAYRLRGGSTVVADIRNCRIVTVSHARRLVQVLGGSCVHDPPRGFSSPNGDTPLRGGGLLVTEIGGWIDRLDAAGRLVWSVRSPIAYPSDAQLLPNGRILVAGFTDPGRIVELTPTGRVTWSFGSDSGPNRLDKPSLAVRLPNGMIAANDDYNERVIVIDPRAKRIVWQYGHTGVAGSALGYLNKPDGLDLLPAQTEQRLATATTSRASSARALSARVIGTLPAAGSRLAAVALAGKRVLVLGGLVGGTSSNQILAGPPSDLRRIGTLPAPTHDDAAVAFGRFVYLLGGGRATSSDAVVRVDPRTGAAHRVGTLGEPLSDLGAAAVGGSAYIAGGYTGSRYATAVLRFTPGVKPSVVTRLPVGLRYAGVAAVGRRLYVAGGLATAGPTKVVYAVDPTAGTVQRVATLPTPVAHAALATLGGALYLIGGGSARLLRIDPASGTVTVAGRLPRPLADPAAVTLGREIVVLGGSSSRDILALR